MTVGQLIDELSVYDRNVQVHIKCEEAYAISYRVTSVETALYQSMIAFMNFYPNLPGQHDDCGKRVVVLS